MTGPERCLEAERLLSALLGRERGTVPGEASIAAEAHVHATLALAAATGASSPADSRAWLDIAGTKLSDG